MLVLYRQHPRVVHSECASWPISTYFLTFVDRFAVLIQPTDDSDRPMPSSATMQPLAALVRLSQQVAKDVLIVSVRVPAEALGPLGLLSLSKVEVSPSPVSRWIPERDRESKGQ